MQLASIKCFSFHQELLFIACASILMLTLDNVLVQVVCNSWNRQSKYRGKKKNQQRFCSITRVSLE